MNDKVDGSETSNLKLQTSKKLQAPSYKLLGEGGDKVRDKVGVDV